MELTDRLRAWTHARQKLGDPASTPLQALRAVVAVYATHPTAPVALWARSHSFSAARYRRLDRDRQAIRVPAMRRTVFLVARADAARVFTAVRASPKHVERPLKRYGVSPASYERVAKQILKATREALPATRLEEIAELESGKRTAVLRALRYEGRLLTLAGDSLLSSPHRYVATSAWLDDGLDAGDPDEALAWLGGEYLRAYGPARVADFAWWSGTTKRAARAALEPHETVDVGDGLLLLAAEEAAFGRVKRLRGAVDLLPKWDAYTMGHAPDGRRRFVHPDVQKRVYTPLGTGLPGDGNPVVLVDGEAVATWTFTRKEGAAVQPFDTLPPKARKRVDERLETVAGLLGGEA